MSITVRRLEGITNLRLDRPSKRNAFTFEMIEQLHDGITSAIKDHACRCIVIDGAGDHFCAGRDLQAFGEERSVDEITAGDDLWADIFRQLDQCDLPSVAVVSGYAFAGGFTLAMGCDFVLADKTAQFQVSEMRHNFPAAINTPLLGKLLGPRLALELAILGETVSAERLYAMGLINRIVDDQRTVGRCFRPGDRQVCIHVIASNEQRQVAFPPHVKDFAKPWCRRLYDTRLLGRA